jgi:hypothetical protein
LDDREIFTTSSQITLDLSEVSLLKVRTNKSCQGMYMEKNNLINHAFFRPNPILYSLEVFVPVFNEMESNKEIPVVVYNSSGQRDISNSYKITDGRIVIDMSHLSSAVYIFHLIIVDKMILQDQVC